MFKHTKKTKQIMSKLASKRKGKKAPNYKDGRSFKKYYCIDCGKRISLLSKRCLFHSNKKQKGQSRNKGKNNPMFGKSSPNKHNRYKNGYYKKNWMRSGYEISFAKWLDKQDIKWLYEPKRFYLGEVTYVPDFYLPEKKLYIEIKGKWYPDAIKKFNKFKDKYPKLKIEVFDFKKLREKKIIKG